MQTKPTENLAQRPTPIKLVDYPLAEGVPEPEPQQPIYEIDQPPILPEPEVPVLSERRAEHEQRVEQEQAPEADDVRDQARIPEPSVATDPPQAPPVETQPPPAAGATPQPDLVGETKPRQRSITEPLVAEKELSDPAAVDPPQLTREQLFPSASIMQQIAQGQQAERDRTKEREDVEIGDTVWLNLQHDRLVSFFRRFHDRVDRVWNYPIEAATNGIEGTLELLIIVTRQGELVDVDLTRTSGSDILDFEAIQAVYRAAPFGPLGRHYPHDELRIRAHFRYRISGRYIFGR